MEGFSERMVVGGTGGPWVRWITYAYGGTEGTQEGGESGSSLNSATIVAPLYHILGLTSFTCEIDYRSVEEYLLFRYSQWNELKRIQSIRVQSTHITPIGTVRYRHYLLMYQLRTVDCRL